MNLLILATDYPDLNGGISSFFIHSRNIEYLSSGISVVVISFKAKEDYIIDGIKVITEESYQKNFSKEKFDIMVVHAPNLRNHYKFIKRHAHRFVKIVFFFHGHEVLVKSEVYPKPYSYAIRRIKDNNLVNNIYDRFKLLVWKKYFESNVSKISFVFVSNWMRAMFCKYSRLSDELINSKSYIIYNCVGEEFLNDNYDIDSNKDFDFITIRGNLDGSKYAIDIVNKIAIDNPNYRFCVIGKGDFFRYNNKPFNLYWLENSLAHKEIKSYLNRSRFALMPTRTDAQGVMACEIATFGIPLITSDIDVCTEVFMDFNNVVFINNEETHIDLDEVINNLSQNTPAVKNYKFSKNKTIDREVELFYKLMKEKI